MSVVRTVYDVSIYLVGTSLGPHLHFITVISVIILYQAGLDPKRCTVSSDSILVASIKKAATRKRPGLAKF